MSELPSGTVTFLFSDVEGSTRLMQQLGEGWPDVLGAQRRLLRGSLGSAGGREVDSQGDAFFFVFGRARDAVTGAAATQTALAEHRWPEDVELRVRMGIHTGEPVLGEEGYVGVDVVCAARICSAAHGGQVLVSGTTRSLVGDAEFRDLGTHRLKDLDDGIPLHQLVVPGLPADFPAPRTGAQTLPIPFADAGEDLGRRAEAAAAELRRSIEQSVAEDLAATLPQVQLDALEGPPTSRVPTRRSRIGRLFRRGRQ